MSLRRHSFSRSQPGAYAPIGAKTFWITFKSAAGRDPSTGKALTPAPFVSLWAKLSELQGQELYKAQQIAQQVTILVQTEYYAGLQENMTITTEDGRTFQIRDIQDPDGRKFELWIYCEELGQNAGQQ